eukprot:1387631-Rhodomonas_salina.1
MQAQSQYKESVPQPHSTAVAVQGVCTTSRGDDAVYGARADVFGGGCCCCLWGQRAKKGGCKYLFCSTAP